MIASDKFRGWGQYTKAEFDTLSNTDKYGKLIFVRDLDSSGTTVNAQIYFGTRLYAEINDSGATSEIINNIIKALGTMVNSNGQFVRFSIDHEILSGATSATDALVLLESAIVSEANRLGNEIEALGERISTIEEIILYVTGNDINNE